MATAAIGTPERRAKDKAMIEDGCGWSMSVLPLKNPSRYETDREHACGYITLGAPTMVIIGTIYRSGPFLQPEMYESVDAMLNDGWTVD